MSRSTSSVPSDRWQPQELYRDAFPKDSSEEDILQDLVISISLNFILFKRVAQDLLLFFYFLD